MTRVKPALPSSKREPRRSKVSSAAIAATGVAAVTLWLFVPPMGAVVSGETTTTVVGSSTTLPSAVTTIPEGCPARPQAQAVFVGKVRQIGRAEVGFEVLQVRAGSVDGLQVEGLVRVVYGSDAQFLALNDTYLVGVIADGASGQLQSTVREDNEMFGGAEIAGQTDDGLCPLFENPGRTLNVDGSSVDSGVFTELLSRPMNILVALAVPPLVALGALTAVVWWRRAQRTAPRRR